MECIWWRWRQWGLPFRRVIEWRVPVGQQLPAQRRIERKLPAAVKSELLTQSELAVWVADPAGGIWAGGEQAEHWQYLAEGEGMRIRAVYYIVYYICLLCTSIALLSKVLGLVVLRFKFNYLARKLRINLY